MQKMMSPKTRIDWYPTSGFADYNNPTITELNAGTNISCAIVRGYTLNPTASDTDTTASICDNSNVENPGFSNYEGTLTFFRDSNIVDNTSVYNQAWALFRRKGASGFLARRVGKLSSVAYVVGDEVEVFGFISDNPSTVDSGTGAVPIQFTVVFLKQGQYSGMVYAGPLLAATVTSSTPATSPVLGGNVVVVAGTNFYGPLIVTVGGVPVTNYTVTSPTSLQINSTPPHAAGSAIVSVTNPQGTPGTGGAITYS